MNEASRLAVLEANQHNMQNVIHGFGEDMADHEKKDDDRFERQFHYMRGMKEEILDTIGGLEDRISTKVNILWDEKNQRHGAFKFSGLVAHCLTSLITLGGAFGIIKVLK